MAGMYSAPGCFTCKFGEATGPVEARQWQCNWHRRQLPSRLSAEEFRILICQRFVPYSDDPPVADPSDRMKKLYPDAGVLYSYPNEYSTRTDLVGAFDELPAIDASTT